MLSVNEESRLDKKKSQTSTQENDEEVEGVDPSYNMVGEEGMIFAHKEVQSPNHLFKANVVVQF